MKPLYALGDAVSFEEVLASTSSLDKRFAAKVRVTSGGCWEWWGSKVRTAGVAYGQFWNGSRLMLAHRWSHERFVGPIPEGYEVDHLCAYGPCVNPGHLEAVTPQENKARASRRDPWKSRMTHCKEGHEYTTENTYWYQKHDGTNPFRMCRTCMRKSNLETRARNPKRGKKPNALSEEIRSRREALGLTQAGLAGLLGLTPKFGFSQVSGWELGRARPSRKTLARMRAVWGEDFAGGG